MTIVHKTQGEDILSYIVDIEDDEIFAHARVIKIPLFDDTDIYYVECSVDKDADCIHKESMVTMFYKEAEETFNKLRDVARKQVIECLKSKLTTV